VKLIIYWLRQRNGRDTAAAQTNVIRREITPTDNNATSQNNQNELGTFIIPTVKVTQSDEDPFLNSSNNN
ncbi:MAG: hypothetical protein MHPSP_001678, partial [Paramarteilia canceri]